MTLHLTSCERAPDPGLTRSEALELERRMERGESRGYKGDPDAPKPVNIGFGTPEAAKCIIALRHYAGA